MHARTWLLLGAGTLAACARVVGADFDDRYEVDDSSGGAVASSGGTQASTGGKGGSVATSGGSSNSSGGAAQTQGGASVASGGQPSGGTVSIEAGAGGQAGGDGGASESGGTTATSGGQTSAGGATSSGGTTARGGATCSGGTVAQGGDGGFGGEGGSDVPDQPVLHLNEVKGGGSGQDFIELINLGPGPIALQNYTIADSDHFFRLPASTSIPALGYALILMNAGANGVATCETVPCFSVTWGVAQSGEKVSLFEPGGATVDETTYPGQGSNGVTNTQTWGRLPNGSGLFAATRPTRGLPNLAP